MRGVSADRPELAGLAIPLEIEVAALPCRGGEDVMRALFEPLGWQVDAVPVPLDRRLRSGATPGMWTATRRTLRLADALNHLYVLLPVLDDAKHYWVSTDEIDKLLRAGEGWLAGHPARGADRRGGTSPAAVSRADRVGAAALR